MALFIARAIMVILGIIYTALGLWMTGMGVINELALRTFVPVLVFVYGEPPRPVDDSTLDEFLDGDYIPFTVSGIMTLVVGVCFLCIIP